MTPQTVPLRPTSSRLATVAAAICLSVAPAAALAQQMVSIKGKVVNMRSAPSTSADVMWELSQGYPLQVVAKQGTWLKVRDFENDTGWIFQSLTHNRPHHIVKSRTANIRSGPGTTHRVVGQARYGEVLRTREKRDGWVRVESTAHPDGWISRGLLWGW